MVQGPLTTPEELSDITLRANSDASVVRVGDVAQVEIGSATYHFSTGLNSNPSTVISVQLAPAADTLSTAPLILEKMDELSRYYPPGIGVPTAVGCLTVCQSLNHQSAARLGLSHGVVERF